MGLGLAVVMAVGCKKDGNEHRHGASGAELFATYCKGCHGARGGGNFLEGVPPNRTTRLTVNEIAHRILESDDPNRKMPTFPKLTRLEAQAIAQHVVRLREQKELEQPFWTDPIEGDKVIEFGSERLEAAHAPHK